MLGQLGPAGSIIILVLLPSLVAALKVSLLSPASGSAEGGTRSVVEILW